MWAWTLVLLGISGCELPLTGRTPAVERSGGTPVSEPISRLERVTLGGAPQYVLVRGADRTLPIVLFLHGGPGMPSMYLAHDFQRPMEREFVMVHWDRRGAGKSYAAREPIDSLGVRRTLADLYQLRDWLRREVGPNPVILVGHSWGSYLGMLAVRERPSEFAAYVATGVVVPDRARHRAAQRSCVERRALETGDTLIAARLGEFTEATPIPESMLFRVGGELVGARSFWPILRTGLLAPEYTLRDVLNVRKGAQLVAARMRHDVADGWLTSDPTVAVPVLFALGRHDCNTPSQAAAEFLQTIRAPSKQLIWFERSAHFPFWEQPELFRAVLRRAAAAAAQRAGE